VNTRQKIILFLQNKGPSSGTAIADNLSITRQAVNKHLKKIHSPGPGSKKRFYKGSFILPFGRYDSGKAGTQISKEISCKKHSGR